MNATSLLCGDKESNIPMNQSERIKLHEVKTSVAEILGIGLGCDAQVITSKEFTFDDLLSILDVLRVNVKYLQFDAEASKREKVLLEKLLKDSEK